MGVVDHVTFLFSTYIACLVSKGKHTLTTETPQPPEWEATLGFWLLGYLFWLLFNVLNTNQDLLTHNWKGIRIQRHDVSAGNTKVIVIYEQTIRFKKEVIFVQGWGQIHSCVRKEEFGMLYFGMDGVFLLRGPTQPTDTVGSLLWSTRWPWKRIGVAGQRR